MPTTTFTGQVQQDLAPFLTADADPFGDHQRYLNALAQMFEPLYGLAMDQGYATDASWVPGWSVLLDVDECPAKYLGFLAQFNGTVLPAGIDAVSARQIIRAESGFQRGTPAAIISAARRYLNGTQSVTLEERSDSTANPNAYAFVLIVRPEEVTDLNGLTNAVNVVKPAGLQWTLIQTDAWTIAQMEAAGYSNLTAMETAFTTVNGLEQDWPGH